MGGWLRGKCAFEEGEIAAAAVAVVVLLLATTPALATVNAVVESLYT